MFSKEIFQKETDLQKIQELQKQYSYMDCRVNEIKIDDNFRINCQDFKEQGGTELFYQNLCRILKIPFPFSQKIPPDLFITNVDRLKEEFNQVVKIVKRDNAFVNILPISKQDGKLMHFQPIDTSELLEYFNTDNYKFQNIYVGDEGASIDLVHNDLNQFDLEKEKLGGIINVGYRIQNPFTFLGNHLQGNLYLNQLVCTNGMVLPRRFLNSSISLNKKLGDEIVYIEKFKNEIDRQVGSKFDLNKISELYRTLSNTPIKYRWLKPIFYKLRGVDEPMFNSIFGIKEETWEEDKKYFDEKFKTKENDDYEMTYFDIIYNMTERCQKLSYRDRIMVEDYNSKIIDIFEDQLLKNVSLN